MFEKPTNEFYHIFHDERWFISDSQQFIAYRVVIKRLFFIDLHDLI